MAPASGRPPWWGRGCAPATGTTRVRPTTIRFGLLMELACCIAWTETPDRLAMPDSVSPGRTTYRLPPTACRGIAIAGPATATISEPTISTPPASRSPRRPCPPRSQITVSAHRELPESSSASGAHRTRHNRNFNPTSNIGAGPDRRRSRPNWALAGRSTVDDVRGSGGGPRPGARRRGARGSARASGRRSASSRRRRGGRPPRR